MRRPLRSKPALLLGIAAIWMGTVTACGTSGRELRPPIDNAVSPTRSTAAPTTTAPLLGSRMELTAPGFGDGSPIPAQHACQGLSPALSWSGVPAEVQELALAVTDADAGGFVHWLVTGIAPTDGSVADGQVPAGAQPRPNDAASLTWTGPCPPAGTTHTYVFLLLGRTDTTPLPLDPSPKDLVALLEEQAGENVATLTATYRTP